MRHAARGLAVALLVLSGACGRQGPPLPPIPRGPLPVEDLVVRQLGAAAVVSFTLPEPRGAAAAQQPVAVELLRSSFPPGSVSADVDAFRRRAEPVADLQEEPLPAGERRQFEDRAGLVDRAGWTLRYAVRVRDRRGRASPVVVARDLAILPELPAPAGLRAEPTADGVRVSWSVDGGSGDAAYHVYRAAGGEPEPERPLNENPLTATEYLDTGVQTGATYLYTVRRALAPGRPYRESASSPPVEVVAEDRFAPDRPAALVAVQEGAAVRLFWNPGRERDIAGYRVYRALDGGEWTRIGADPVDQPLFRDESTRVGQKLAYRVSAVDRADPPNESELSEPASIEVAAEPMAGEPR